jgi:N-methylhydantoinase B
VQLASLRGNVRYAVNAFIGAGQGGSASMEGVSAISFPSNLSNTPIEVLESQAPIRVTDRSIRRNSGGAGAKRGGDGIRFAFEMYGESPAIGSFMINRVRRPAPGLKGGEDGAPAIFRINTKPIASSGQYILNKGDRVLIETGGGGGFGKPNKKAVTKPAKKNKKRGII